MFELIFVWFVAEDTSWQPCVLEDKLHYRTLHGILTYSGLFDLPPLQKTPQLGSPISSSSVQAPTDAKSTRWQKVRWHWMPTWQPGWCKSHAVAGCNSFPYSTFHCECHLFLPDCKQTIFNSCSVKLLPDKIAGYKYISIKFLR